MRKKEHDDFKLLASRVARQKKTMNDRQRRLYRIARELGFSSRESGELRNWSESRIKLLATELNLKEK